MTTWVTYYCLPNIRHPFAKVYEPYPGDRGVLRVAERKRLTLGGCRPAGAEREETNGLRRHLAKTWPDAASMVACERAAVGEERAAFLLHLLELSDWLIDRVVAEVEAKRSAKARRGLPRPATPAGANP